jgi:ABC-type multidrug transport system ATPase subunit
MSTELIRRLGVDVALMSKPDLVILDEPTSGLGSLVQRATPEMLDDVRAKGRTAFCSSRNLSEMERVCDGSASPARANGHPLPPRAECPPTRRL